MCNFIFLNTLDKVELHKIMMFDAIFIGDDWYGNPRWMKTKEDLLKVGSDVVFLPHTDGVSSTMLRPYEHEKIEDNKKDGFA